MLLLFLCSLLSLFPSSLLSATSVFCDMCLKTQNLGTIKKGGQGGAYLGGAGRLFSQSLKINYCAFLKVLLAFELAEMPAPLPGLVSLETGG